MHHLIFRYKNISLFITQINLWLPLLSSYCFMVILIVVQYFNALQEFWCNQGAMLYDSELLCIGWIHTYINWFLNITAKLMLFITICVYLINIPTICIYLINIPYASYRVAFIWYYNIPYSRKVWQGDSLVNLANCPRFIKLKPSKLVLTINNPLTDLLIHQTFFRQMLETSQFAKPSRYMIPQ